MFQVVWLYLFVFGALTIAGGVMGFVKAKSRPSLIAGTTAGLLLLLSGYLVGTSGRTGLFLGFAVSLALALRFVMAFRRTRKLMPAGLMAGLSVAGVALTALCIVR